MGTQSRNRSYCPNAPPVYWQRNTTDLEMRVCQPIRPCSGISVFFFNVNYQTPWPINFNAQQQYYRKIPLLKSVLAGTS